MFQFNTWSSNLNKSLSAVESKSSSSDDDDKNADVIILAWISLVLSTDFSSSSICWGVGMLDAKFGGNGGGSNLALFLGLSWQLLTSLARDALPFDTTPHFFFH